MLEPTTGTARLAEKLGSDGRWRTRHACVGAGAEARNQSMSSSGRVIPCQIGLGAPCLHSLTISRLQCAPTDLGQAAKPTTARPPPHPTSWVRRPLPAADRPRAHGWHATPSFWWELACPSSIPGARPTLPDGDGANERAAMGVAGSTTTQQEKCITPNAFDRLSGRGTAGRRLEFSRTRTTSASVR